MILGTLYYKILKLIPSINILHELRILLYFTYGKHNTKLKVLFALSFENQRKKYNSSVFWFVMKNKTMNDKF